MAVQRLRLIGAKANGAISEVATVGTRTSRTSGSGHATTNVTINMIRIATVDRAVLTATAPIQ